MGPRRLLIDTGEGKPSWSGLLSSVLTLEHTTISQALITHWHPDHIGGVKDLLSLCPEAKISKHSPGAGQCPIDESQTFQSQGATLRAFHCPGHTTDHMALILEEENAMFTGDNVLGHGTAVFEDLTIYLSSLHRMREQFSGRAYPGHGPVIEDGKARIEEYIQHRQQREEEVLSVLRGAEDAKTPMQIVKVVYRDVPENLHEPAERGVMQVLKKLEGEGKVVEVHDGERWRVAGKAAL